MAARVQEKTIVFTPPIRNFVYMILMQEKPNEGLIVQWPEQTIYLSHLNIFSVKKNTGLKQTC